MHPRSILTEFNCLSTNDIKIYIGIILLMGIHTLPSLKGKLTKVFRNTI